MKKKSKFIVFFLSFLPGLSHFYLGLRERAVIFSGLFFAVIFGTLGLSVITGSDDVCALLIVVLPLIWFIALADALFASEHQESNPNGNGAGNQETVSGHGLAGIYNNRKLLTVVFSFIPGAGHMYLGLQKQGLQFMSLFFFSAFFMGWLNMSLFLFILPIIWFYSLFDAYHRVNEGQGQQWEEGLPVFTWLENNPRLMGWGLIATGCLIILEKIVAPFMTWQVRHYFQTGLVAVILIGAGIKLLLGNKGETAKSKEVVTECAKEE